MNFRNTDAIRIMATICPGVFPLLGCTTAPDRIFVLPIGVNAMFLRSSTGKQHQVLVPAPVCPLDAGRALV